MARRRGTGRTQGRGSGGTPAVAHQASRSDASEGTLQQLVQSPRRRDAAVGVRATGEREGRGSGRSQRGGVRPRTGGEARLASGAAASGDVPSATEPTSLDTQGGRTTTPTWDTSDRGQDRAACADGDPDGGVRGGVPRLLVWLPARSRLSRGAARACPSHQSRTCQLGGRGRHQGVLGPLITLPPR
jgi:hypothetical protein